VVPVARGSAPKDKLESDPTAAARSTIRRTRPHAREQLRGGRTAPRPAHTINQEGAQHSRRTGGGESLEGLQDYQMQLLLQEQQRILRERRMEEARSEHSGRASNLNGSAPPPPVPTLRREASRRTQRGAPSPSSRADAPALSVQSQRLPRLLTPPLEGSGANDGALDSQGHVPSELVIAGVHTSGLGDRRRSMSPQETTDHWEVIRSTIPLDETLPSTDSSFTSAAAGPDSQRPRDPADDQLSISADHLADPDESHGVSSVRELDCIYPSDTDSDFDAETTRLFQQAETTDQRRYGHARSDVERELRSLRRDYHQMSRSFEHFRDDYARLERQIAAHNRDGAAETGTGGPGQQQPSRFAPEIRQRSAEATSSTRRHFGDGGERFDFDAFLNSQTTNPLRRIDQHGDPPHGDDVASARSLMQDSADLLENVTREVRQTQAAGDSEEPTQHSRPSRRTWDIDQEYVESLVEDDSLPDWLS